MVNLGFLEKVLGLQKGPGYILKMRMKCIEEGHPSAIFGGYGNMTGRIPGDESVEIKGIYFCPVCRIGIERSLTPEQLEEYNKRPQIYFALN